MIAVRRNIVRELGAVSDQHDGQSARHCQCAERDAAAFGAAASQADAVARRGQVGAPAALRENTAARGETSGQPGGRTMLPAAGLPRRSRDELLASARRGLAEAAFASRSGERYALAHLAALRAAAAVLAARAQPRPGHRGRPASAWQLLAVVAPELQEWAAFFAAGAGRRAAAEAGLAVVTSRDADDLVRQAELFLGIVEAALGVPSQPSLTRPESTEVWTWR
ncbi:hypothetical protein UG55_1005186 [Frankia sp. EI5c]|uniref:SAV_6107 family HEPN domain-containing protein n=1 Tax=Frankia sp. EI5c TaxID=683316 RepID=UPI0007C338E7|nr:SAV_6107 family HEPN domain-containing protein [Frankia sp. EI5c]OAA28671.1 hypothetical protein UG55_1005186 [Frankia sp. EI5c]